MAELQVGGKTLVTQTGTDNPVLGSTVNIPSGVTFPAGHVIQVAYQSGTYSGQTTDTNLYLNTSGWSTSQTSHYLSITKKSSSSIFVCTITGPYWIGSWSYNALEFGKVYIRTSDNSDMTSSTEHFVWECTWDTRAGGDPPQQFGTTVFGQKILTTYQTSAVGTIVYFDVRRNRTTASQGFTNYYDTTLKIEEIQV